MNNQPSFFIRLENDEYNILRYDETFVCSGVSYEDALNNAKEFGIGKEDISIYSLISEKKRMLRGLENKAEKLSIEIAEILGLKSFWTYEVGDGDDPAVADLYNERACVLHKIGVIVDEIERLQHDESNPRMDYAARKVVNNFLKDLGDAEAIEFLKEVGMTTHEVIEQVHYNPHFYYDFFYDDYFLFKEEVIV